MPRVELRAALVGMLHDNRTNVRGLVLQPGTFTPYINGLPAEVEFPKDIILRAFVKLRARLQAGTDVVMRLSHTDVGEMPLKWGKVREVRIDADKGEVWLTQSEPFAEMLQVLTEEAREKLLQMGLSVAGPMRVKRKLGGGYIATDLEVDAIDIVGQGAFLGRITTDVPATLLAMNSAPTGLPPLPPPGVLLVSVDDVAEDLFAILNDAATAQKYVAAYNLAVKSGLLPEAAHRKALAESVTQIVKHQGATNPMPEPVTLAAEEAAALRAKAAKTTDLEQEVVSLRAAIGTKDTELATHKTTADTLQKELDARDARDDVAAAVRANKATPAEEPFLVEVRATLGKDKFQAMLEKRGPQGPPAGEKGHAGKPPVEDSAQSEKLAQAEADIERFGGVKAVASSGLPTIDADIAAVLRAKHADHPTVKARMDTWAKPTTGA